MNFAESRWVSVSPELMRGPQPQEEDLRDLMAVGLGGVVNLRLESEHSRELCQQLGLRYHYFPVRDWTCPEQRQIEEFLSLFEESPSGPLLVHCMGGVGRTGVFVSCYRVARGMDPGQAIRLSHTEVSWMSMNDEQMQFVVAFGRWWAERQQERNR
ncbi:MAG: hypothetical protein AMXMBFR33_55200 [Candidatus Xenobia bacterium]|jgi:protein tyrosine phosphatase (PTP) superfamily phosphohydrolase (DUF442 family)